MPYPAFETLSLDNRLGQPVTLNVRLCPGEQRDTLFVAAPRRQASSLFGKNAESFLIQLLEHFALRPERLTVVELRGDPFRPELWRWRAEWVGRSPMALRSEPVTGSARESFQALLDREPADQNLARRRA